MRLAAAYSKGSLQQQSLQTDEFVTASQDQLEALECSTRASKLDASAGSTRALDPQLVASTSSPRASRKQLRASQPRIFFSLILAFVILMIHSLILPSLSLPIVLGIESLQCTMSFQQLVGIQPQSTTSSIPNLREQELVTNELRRTCRNSEIEKQAAFLNLLWEVELGNLLADKPFWGNQLQTNASENEKNKQLADNKKLQEKNFQSLILEKLVALLPEKHFALAASTQLLGNEAWEKSREASEEISFDKVRGKELPPELRRHQLDRKDLRSDSFRALCPTSFEENSLQQATFKEESFIASTFQEKSVNKTSFADNSFTEETFTKASFTESSLKESSLTESSLTGNSLTENSLKKNGLRKKSFDKTNFSENTFLEDSFSENSLEAKTLNWQLRTQQLGGPELPLSSFDDSSFEKSSFTQSSFEESSFTKSSFRENSLRGNSLNEESFAQESFQSTAFTKSFVQKNFHQHNFNKPSLAESTLEANNFNQRNFEESSFAQSSLEESNLKTGSFEQSSFETNSFDKRSFETTSFSKSSFQEASLATDSFQRQPFSTEFGQLAPATLSTELDPLEETALKKAAYSLEPERAALPGEKLQHPQWDQALDNLVPRGSARCPASLPQLDLYKLELDLCVWLKLPA